MHPLSKYSRFPSFKCMVKLIFTGMNIMLPPHILCVQEVVYIVSYYIKWVTTSWTYSRINNMC